MSASGLSASGLSASGLSAPLVDAWLEGTGAIADVAPRIDDAIQRNERSEDFRVLAQRPDFTTLVSILRLYVRTTLPVTRGLERASWTVTGPSAHPSVTDTYTRLAAVTVGPEETLVLSESRLGDGEPEPGGFLLVDQETLETRVGPVGDMQREFGGAFARSYVPGSEDLGVVSLGFYDWGSFFTLMSAPRVVAAARQLNIRFLSSGASVSPELHVFDIADHLVAVMPGDRPATSSRGVA